MKRLVSFLLLAVLALPYARTPICSSAGHDHGDHDRHHAGISAQAHHDGDASDCHRLMACDTTINGVAPLTPAPTVDGPRLVAERHRTPPGHRAPTRVPLSPPPQTV